MPDDTVLSFDLDDTLWPIAPTIIAAERAVFTWMEANCPRAVAAHSVETMRELRLRMLERFPDRAHDMTFLRRQALAAQLLETGYPERLADDAFEAFYAARNRITPYEDVVPALERLSSRYRLYALSNGNADLGRCGLARYFRGHVNAQSAGAAKPDARIFNELARLAAVPPERIVHVGDDPHADVHGARSARLQAVWVRREPRIWPTQLERPARIIASLAELD